jgi:hypothetical protein
MSQINPKLTKSPKKSRRLSKSHNVQLQSFTVSKDSIVDTENSRDGISEENHEIDIVSPAPALSLPSRSISRQITNNGGLSLHGSDLSPEGPTSNKTYDSFWQEQRRKLIPVVPNNGLKVPIKTGLEVASKALPMEAPQTVLSPTPSGPRIRIPASPQGQNEVKSTRRDSTSSNISTATNISNKATASTPTSKHQATSNSIEPALEQHSDTPTKPKEVLFHPSNFLKPPPKGSARSPMEGYSHPSTFFQHPPKNYVKNSRQDHSHPIVSPHSTPLTHKGVYGPNIAASVPTQSGTIPHTSYAPPIGIRTEDGKVYRRPLVVAISGCTSSGKSSLALILGMIFFRTGTQVRTLHQDNYFALKSVCQRVSWPKCDNGHYYLNGPAGSVIKLTDNHPYQDPIIEKAVAKILKDGRGCIDPKQIMPNAKGEMPHGGLERPNRPPSKIPENVSHFLIYDGCQLYTVYLTGTITS